MSTASSEDSAVTNPQPIQDKTILQQVRDYWNGRGKLELLTGIIGARQMQYEAKSHQRNRDAEEAYVRKNVWGSDESPAADADMGHTILGDVTNPTPIVIAGQQRQGLGTLGTLAVGLLGASIPGLGIAGYLLGNYLANKDQQPAPVVQPNDGDDFSLGLGRIEDYLTDQ